MLEDWADQAVMQSALRFDGGKWTEFVRPGSESDLTWLTEPVVENLILHDRLENNLAVFFGLQRYLYKWGGEQLPGESRTRLAYYLLYLHLHDAKVPKKFAIPTGTVSFDTDESKTTADVVHAVQEHVRHVWPLLAHAAVDQAFNWAKLNKPQVGRFGEYFAKLELTRLGAEVYTSEVDDRGVDFILRTEAGDFAAVQVKTVRSYQALSLEKVRFGSRHNSWLVLVELIDGRPPHAYLVPAVAWEREDDKYFTSSPDGSTWKLHFDATSRKTLSAKYAMTSLPKMG